MATEEKRDLQSEIDAFITTTRPVTESINDYSSFSEAATRVETVLSDEWGTAAVHCRFELVCNTSGVCEVKLVCDF